MVPAFGPSLWSLRGAAHGTEHRMRTCVCTCVYAPMHAICMHGHRAQALRHATLLKRLAAAVLPYGLLLALIPMMGMLAALDEQGRLLELHLDRREMDGWMDGWMDRWIDG